MTSKILTLLSRFLRESEKNDEGGPLKDMTPRPPGEGGGGGGGGGRRRRTGRRK